MGEGLQLTRIRCPYCGEFIEVVVDGSAGAQEYYEDCSVCCAPILFKVLISDEYCLQIDANREDE